MSSDNNIYTSKPSPFFSDNNIYTSKPSPFFSENIIVHKIKPNGSPGLSGLNVGFEFDKWRYDDFSNYILEWLPEFALRYSDLKELNHSNAMSFLRKAAKTVYQTDKYSKRGEFGELILHALIREIFCSQPVISKIFYKSGVNETVKGFDAVHVVESGNDLELWLGEAKFYMDIKRAVKDVVAELHNHSQREYLRNEFTLITGKIDNNWKHAEKIKQLIHARTNLEDVFNRLCIPVLLTYESDVVKNYQNYKKEFVNLLHAEILSNYTEFKDQVMGMPLNIHLFLLPLLKKTELVNCLNKKLKGLQL